MQCYHVSGQTSDSGAAPIRASVPAAEFRTQ